MAVDEAISEEEEEDVKEEEEKEGGGEEGEGCEEQGGGDEEEEAVHCVQRRAEVEVRCSVRFVDLEGRSDG